MSVQLEMYEWIKSLRDTGLTEEEIEGCLEFFQEEWKDFWDEAKEMN